MKNLDKLMVALVIIFLVTFFINIYFISYSKSSPYKPVREFSVTGRAQAGWVGFVILSRCYSDLVQGWNLVSLCANSTNTSVDDVFSDIDGEYRFVMLWNESSQDFVLYSPKSTTNPFENVSYNYSYFIYYNEPSKIMNMEGSEFDNKNISMLYGWNSPNYPYTITGYVKNYTGSFEDKLRYVMKWNKTGQEFMIYSPKSTSNPFETIETGQGQLISIKDTGGALLVYNKSGLK